MFSPLFFCTYRGLSFNILLFLLGVDLDIPIKGHGPVKTSSPIQADVGAEEQDNEKDQAMSPILFLCEDQEQEEAEKEPLPIQKPQCNGNITEE